MTLLWNVQIIPSDLGVLRAFVFSQQCSLAYQGGGKGTFFNTSKSHDKIEHLEDEEKSTLDYKLDENETYSNDNQDAKINTIENDEKHVNSKVF